MLEGEGLVRFFPSIPYNMLNTRLILHELSKLLANYANLPFVINSRYLFVGFASDVGA